MYEDKKVTVTMSKDLWTRINKTAGKKKLSNSALIRVVLLQYFKREEKAVEKD